MFHVKQKGGVKLNWEITYVNRNTGVIGVYKTTCYSSHELCKEIMKLARKKMLVTKLESF